MFLSLGPSVCPVSVTAFTGLKLVFPSPLWASRVNWLSDPLLRPSTELKPLQVSKYMF